MKNDMVDLMNIVDEAIRDIGALSADELETIFATFGFFPERKSTYKWNSGEQVPLKGGVIIVRPMLISENSNYDPCSANDCLYDLAA